MTIDTKRLRELHATADRYADEILTAPPNHFPRSAEFYRAAHAAFPKLLDEPERLQDELQQRDLGLQGKHADLTRVRAERDQWKAEADRYWQHIQDAKAENEELLADVRRLREERDWADVHMPVQVDIITGAGLVELGCCCASEDWTDVTKGCTDAWLKKNGY